MQSHIKLNVCSIYNGRSALGAYPGEGRYFEIGTPLLMSYSRGHTLQLTCWVPTWLLVSQKSVAPLNMLYCITMHVMHGSRK